MVNQVHPEVFLCLEDIFFWVLGSLPAIVVVRVIKAVLMISMFMKPTVSQTLHLHVISHLILTIILSYRYYWLYPKVEGTEAQRR